MEEMFCILDANGVIQYISPSMQQKFDDFDYIKGTNVEQLVHPDDYLPTRERFVKTIEEVIGFETEIRLKHSTQQWIVTAIKAFPLIDDAGKVQTILIYTNLNRNQEENRLPNKTAIHYDNVHVLLWSLDIKKGKHSVIGNAQEMFGFTEEEFKNNPFIYKKLIHPEDHIQINEMEKSISLNQTALFEFRTVHPNGKVKWSQTKVIPMTDLFGNIIRIDGVSIDITNQKEKMEEKGDESTNQKNQFMVIVDPQGIITSISPFPEKLPEALKIKWIKKSIYSFLSERQTKQLADYITNKPSQGVQLVQTTLSSDNGLVYKVAVTIFPLVVNGVVAKMLFHVRYQNIYRTTKKRLLANEKAIQKMIAEKKVGLWHLNLEAQSLIVTKGIETISGYSAKEFLNDLLLWRKNVYFKDQAILKKSEPSTIQGIPVKHQYRILTKTGDCRWIEERVLPTVDSNGEIIFLEGIVIDITKKKQHQNSELFSSLMEKSTTMMATFNLDGEITSVNTAAQEITGYTEDELLAMNFLDLLPDEIKNKVTDFMACSITLGVDVSNKIVTMIHKNGQPLNLSIHALPLFNQDSMSGLYVMAKDFSSELALEESLLKSKQTFYEKYNAIPFCLFILEIDRTTQSAQIIEANEFAFKTLNYSEEEIINKSFGDLIYSKNYRMNAFLQDNMEYLHIRSVFLTKDGKKLPVLLYSHLTKWEGKEIILTIAKVIQSDSSQQTFEKNDSGRQLRVLMAEMDINTMELANLTGLTTATISNLRTGKVKKPNIETAEKIAAVLGVHLSSLWPELWY